MAKKKKSTKEKNGEPFEKLMTAIQMAFHPDDKVEHNIKVRQSSGVNRQVDVSVAGRKIIVECKDKSRKVMLTEMDAFIYLCQSTDSEGIFVSRKGFAPNVIKNAQEAGIKTYTLTEIEGERFRDSFYIPPITMIVLHHRYLSFWFSVDAGHTASTPLDLFIYDHTGKQMDPEELVKPNYNTYMQYSLYGNFYKPIATKLAEKARSYEELNDLLRQSAVVMKEALTMPKNRFFIKQKEGLVPIAILFLEIAVNYTIKDAETRTYQQKDINNNLLSQTVTTDIRQGDRLYSFTVVNTGDPNAPAVTLIPRWRSSEILKVPRLN